MADAAPADSHVPGKYEGGGVLRDAPFVVTPDELVVEMLRMGQVSGDDLLYDLGSGDGRIVIAAARQFGTRGVGIDIDPRRIVEANQNARTAGVDDRVTFIEGDLFATDLREATVVTLYLLPAVNLRLRPKLLAELRPGTPVVSHDYDMGEWAPDEHVEIDGAQLYLWIIPAQVQGQWRWTGPEGQPRTANVRQEFQELSVESEEGGGAPGLSNGRVNGGEVTFELTRRGTDGRPVVESYRGQVDGRIITGTVTVGNRSSNWQAQLE